MEKEIIIEQEEYLRTLPSLTRVLASASSGQARIELEFPFGIDLNKTLQLTKCFSDVGQLNVHTKCRLVFRLSHSGQNAEG